MDQVKEKAPSYTIGGKRGGGPNAGDGPGPGAYNGNVGGHVPGGIMGGRHGGKFGDSNPGPGSYAVGNTFDKRGPAFGKEARQRAGTAGAAPGPGAYNANGSPFDNRGAKFGNAA